MDIASLIDELEQTLAALPILASGQPLAAAGEGNWSVLDVVYHMLDVEVNDFQAHIRQALAKEAWVDTDPIAALDGMRKHGASLEETLQEWKAERQASLAWLRGLTQDDWSAQVESPWRIFSAGTLLANWVAHDCHHLRQLVELKYAKVAHHAPNESLEYAGDW